MNPYPSTTLFCGATEGARPRNLYRKAGPKIGNTRHYSKRTCFNIFLLLFTVYLLSYNGRITSTDEAYILAATESLAHGRLDVNQVAARQWDIANPRDRLGIPGPDRNIYGHKGIGESIAALPFYYVGALVPPVGAMHAMLLTNAVIVALTGALLYGWLDWLGLSRGAALAGALSFGLATFAWLYARSVFSEPLVGLGLALALVGVSWFHHGGAAWASVLCGLGAGIAMMAVLASVILIPVFALGLAWRAFAGRDWRRLWRAGWGMALGLAGPVLTVAAFNLLRFGSPLESGYIVSEFFGLAPHKGLLGLLISPARGMLVYAPVMLLVLPGMVFVWRRRRFSGLLALAAMGVYTLFYATTRVWWAGLVWGTRYLVPVLPLGAIFIAEVWEASRGRRVARAALIVLIALSVAIQIVAVAGDAMATEVALWDAFNFEGAPAGDWYYMGEEALFSVRYAPLVVQAQRVLAGELTPLMFSNAALFIAGCIALAAALRWYSHTKIRVVITTTTTLTTLITITHSPTQYTPDTPKGRTEAIAHILTEQRPNDAIISTAPYLFEYLLDRHPSLPPIYGLPYEQPIDDLSRPLLEGALEKHARLWFISVWRRPADPNSHIEYWLAAHAFPIQAWEFGAYRVTLFSTPVEPDYTTAPKAHLGDAFLLERVTLAQQEDILQVETTWHALHPVETDYQIFVQVYDASKMTAQADHSPVWGFAPTSTWRTNETITDRIAVPAGDLPVRLALGLYVWHTGERVPIIGSTDNAVWITP